MKILYIVPDITDSGGIARVISLKANYFVTNLDYEVNILSVNDSSSNCFYDFNPNIKWFNIKYSKNALFFLWNYIRFIKKIIRTEKPDVIIICDAVLWVFIPWLIRTKTPIIFETHFSVFFKKSKTRGIVAEIRSKLIRFFKQESSKKFNCFVFETHEGSREWNLNNSKVIPNPLSFAVKKSTNLENKKAMAVCMNSYVKGLDRLLLVWGKVIENHADWVIDIYGQWNDDLKYRNRVNTLQISNNVNFILPTRDIENCYNQSSIFLMTSRSEAFGMVLIEAMASGLPCVAYDCPIGPRTIIKEGENGFLVEDGNVDAFVQKLELLIDDENLRLQMGRNAQEDVKKYDMETIMQQWESLFESLVKV